MRQKSSKTSEIPAKRSLNHASDVLGAKRPNAPGVQNIVDKSGYPHSESQLLLMPLQPNRKLMNNPGYP